MVPPAKQSAFTLVELLVVMAIIAISAGMLLAALAAAKEKARAAQCVNQLHQWSLAYRMYANDNSDFLPRRGQGVQPLAEIDRPEDWFNSLPVYFGLPSFAQMVTNNMQPVAHGQSVFVCPSANDLGGAYFLSYAMNMNLSPWNLPVATKVNEVKWPAAMVVMTDAPGPYSAVYPSKKAYSPVPRHHSRVNLLFLGGQVQTFAGDYVGCGAGDPGRKDVSWLTGTDSDAMAPNY